MAGSVPAIGAGAESRTDDEATLTDVKVKEGDRQHSR